MEGYVNIEERGIGREFRLAIHNIRKAGENGILEKEHEKNIGAGEPDFLYDWNDIRPSQLYIVLVSQLDLLGLLRGFVVLNYALRGFACETVSS